MNEKIVALSIGSKHLTATMSKVELGKEKIIASVVVDSQGIKKGRIYDVSLLSVAMEEVLDKLKKATKEKITDLYIALGTEDIRIIENRGFCNLDKNKEIDKEQIEKAYLDGKKVEITEEECIVDAIIEKFYTSESGYIDNPIGLKAKKLEVEVKVIVAKKELSWNLKTILMNLGLEVNGFILSIEALNNLLIKEEEKDKNNVIIDFGAEKIEIGIFKRNKLESIDFISLGGEDITKDIAIVTKIEESLAEDIKIANSGNFISTRNDFGKIEVGNDKIEGTLLYEIINARLEEITSYIKKSLETCTNYDKIDNIIVIGDGIVNFEKIEMFLKEIFNKNIAIIGKKDLNNENYSTIMSIAIVKEVHNRLKLLYKKDVFSIILYNKAKDGTSKNTTYKDKYSKENKGKLSKVLSFLGDIF